VSNNRTDSRPTIGLVFVSTVGMGNSRSDPWSGVVDQAREQDANLICFPGGRLDSPPVRNAILGLVGPKSVDGIVVDAEVGSRVSPEEFWMAVDHYRPLLLVSIGFVRQDIPHVAIDNEKGIKDVLAHLVGVHGCHRIAFVRGPETSAEAEERYSTYKEVLAQYGIPFDQALVAPGAFSHDAGRDAVRLFMDERKVEFDAIVAASDDIAIGILEALQARGVRVPDDVAVAGFGDVEGAAALTPALTTVRRPAYEQGKRAAEMLLDLISGREVPQQVTLPTELAVRESCGCVLPVVAQAKTGRATRVPQTLDAVLSTQREQILSTILRETDGFDGIAPEQMGGLLDAFAADLKGESKGLFFLSALRGALSRMNAKEDAIAWHKMLSVMRRRVMPYLDEAALSSAEDLWHQGRVLVGDMVHRVEARETLDSEKQDTLLRDMNRELNAVVSVSGLADVVARRLPELGIPSACIALYDEEALLLGQGEPTECSRLVLAYDESGRAELEPDGRLFLSRQLLPDGLLSSEARYTMIVGDLYSREGLRGFALFRMGPRDGRIYHLVQEQIGGALRGIKLVQRVEERSKALQEANYALQRRAIRIEASAEVSRVIASIFELKELLRRTAELISERFNFYHVGIFLLDEAGEWLVLEEATGEAGAQMKADGHRLAIGDTSMVGWAAAHRKPRIALDVGRDAVRFSHPLLPHTRSEMALPLVVGDRLLGVLNVQSLEEAAFDQDDMRTLQTMADQVALAVENAQQASDEATLLEATSPIYRASRLLTTATTTTEVADAIIASVAETGADGCNVVGFEFSSTGEAEALLYLGVWRQDREPQFQTGLRLPIDESPFPLDMVSTLWSVADVDSDDRLPRSARVVFQSTGAKALVNIPLRSGERVIGQVVVIRAAPGPFPDTALRLYEVLSDQAAVALERAQLLEETQQRAGRERQARHAIDRIRRAVDVGQALQAAAEELSWALGVPHVAVELSLEAASQE
jgi:DNA-binding LacI/PurR family transcriptional regulator/GAF domain-containing protein